MQILIHINSSSTLSTNTSTQIVFVFVSTYDSSDKAFGEHLITHGDGAKDVAFEVEELDVIVKGAKERGGKVLRDIWEEKDDNGSVRFAVVQTYGDTTHTFGELTLLTYI